MNKSNGFSTFTKIWFLVYAIFALAFASMVIYMDVLPQKYLLYMAATILVVSLLLMIPLCLGRFRKRVRVPAFIISLLLIAVYITGAVYIINTLDFLDRITNSNKVQTEEYCVVVYKDGPYNTLEDIEGKEVAIFTSSDGRYAEAQKKLSEEVNIRFVSELKLSSLAEKLLTKEKEIIFVSRITYDGLCESINTFKKTTKVIHTVKLQQQNQENAKNVDVTEMPFNVYISGLDVEGTIDVLSRSDVNMIMTINPKTHKILLTSIPRDYYVQVPAFGNVSDKLTHTGIYGIGETISTVEQLTGAEINYYIKVNYTTVTQLVDAIGGITVDSDYEFSTHGMDTSYYFNEGENYLDGSRALAFARERKSFSDGDFQRNKNQQKVLKGILDKALSSETILMSYTDILSALGDYIDINMTKKDMQALVKMQLQDMPDWTIIQQSISGTGGSDVCYSLGGLYASVVYIDSQSVADAVAKIDSVMKDE